ncbi:MAG TPA: outer membrane lipoprotein-sorting protein [Nitrospiria bacterium]
MTHKIIVPTVFLFLISIFIPPAFSETAVEKGLAIAVEADKRDEGFGDFTADLQMILKNRHGEESTRSIRIRNLEVRKDGDKILSIFDFPRDVKGTTFLSYTHKTGPDDQWLYLPAIKRVKRINAGNKSGSFMSSEFAYEDITSDEVEKYTYKWLRDENCGGLSCFVIERNPVDSKSGYLRQEAWIDKEEYRIQKVVYYDRKGDLLKTHTFSGYQQYLGKYWRPDVEEMVNHQTEKSTQLVWKNYKFQTGLNDRDFSKTQLERVR